MAKQKGVFPITGRLDEVVFYQSKGGNYHVKKKGSLDKERVKRDPAFEGSRKASSAFSRSARGTELLRLAMGGNAKELAETRMAGKMNATMMRILKGDKSSAYLDEKLISRGNLQLLIGQAWDKLKPFQSSLFTPYKVNIDRGLGELEVHFETLQAKKALTAPKTASHYELFAVGARIDFEDGEISRDQVSSGMLPINNVKRSVSIKCNVAAGGTLPLVLGLGIVFYQELNEVLYRLQEGGSFEIVGVEALAR